MLFSRTLLTPSALLLHKVFSFFTCFLSTHPSCSLHVASCNDDSHTRQQEGDNWSTPEVLVKRCAFNHLTHPVNDVSPDRKVQEGNRTLSNLLPSLLLSPLLLYLRNPSRHILSPFIVVYKAQDLPGRKQRIILLVVFLVSLQSTSALFEITHENHPCMNLNRPQLIPATNHSLSSVNARQYPSCHRHRPPDRPGGQTATRSRRLPPHLKEKKPRKFESRRSSSLPNLHQPMSHMSRTTCPLPSLLLT